MNCIEPTPHIGSYRKKLKERSVWILLILLGEISSLLELLGIWSWIQ